MTDTGSDLDNSNSPTIITTDNHVCGDSISTRPDDGESWCFKITKSPDTNDNEHDYKLLDLLKTPQKSILGDTWICTEGSDKYYLDRAILASKSNYLARLSEVNEEIDMGNIIVNMVHEDDVLAPIFQIMYGKDLKSVISEHNFVDLLKNMCHLEMETDLCVFKQFIDETVEPKKQFSHEMIKLYFFILSSRVFEECRCDYLLPTVSRYLSDRILKAYKVKEFLSLPYEGLLRILLHRNEDKLQDKGLIGRICAEWICQEFDDRIVKLIKLVNATKHRYGIFHYCSPDKEKSIIESLKKIDDNLRIQEVEKCFNELLYYHSDITFDSSQLTDEISDESRIRIINAIDQPRRWATFLEKGRFCDIIIDVQGFPFKLHRIKLLLSSPFFYDLFTEDNKSSGYIINEKSRNLIMETYTLDEIDATTFEKIIRYIYEEVVEITSEDLINLFKASKFLQTDDLYEKCYSWFADSDHTTTRVIFNLFQFVCENEKNTELHTEIVYRILGMWPKFDEVAFKNIPLKVLKEIVALPKLRIDTPDEVVDLCSEWIFHDMDKRYCHMYEIAKAINRNFDTKFEPSLPKLETSKNAVQHSLKWVKELLIKILSSNTPWNCDLSFKREQKPCFVGIRTRIRENLSIMDKHFNEIVSINPETLPIYSTKASISINHQSATMIDDKLFVLFNVDEKYYFYVYLPESKKFISLATDDRMTSSVGYVILNWNDEVYYIGGVISLKYCFHLNRWSRFIRIRRHTWWTSNGKNLYQIVFQKSVQQTSGILHTWAMDFEQRKWIILPTVPVRPSLVQGEPGNWDNLPIKTDVIGNDLCVLFKSKTFFYDWKTQIWNSIDNKYEDFSLFCKRDQHILYISARWGAQLYSPLKKNWIADKELGLFKSISAVHTITK